MNTFLIWHLQVLWFKWWKRGWKEVEKTVKRKLYHSEWIQILNIIYRWILDHFQLENTVSHFVQWLNKCPHANSCYLAAAVIPFSLFFAWFFIFGTHLESTLQIHWADQRYSSTGHCRPWMEKAQSLFETRRTSKCNREMSSKWDKVAEVSLWFEILFDTVVMLCLMSSIFLNEVNLHIDINIPTL